MARVILSLVNEETYRTACAALASLGLRPVACADMFTCLTIDVPDILMPAVQAVLRGLPGATITNNVRFRPAALGIEPGENLPPGWKGMTVMNQVAASYMNLPPGLTGRGVRVAVVDTGVDANHPALRGVLLGQESVVEGAGPQDAVGHGTFIASEIAGQPTESPLGPFVGIAPGAKVLSIKVLDDRGDGTMHEVLQGLQRAGQAGVDLVNLSLGTLLNPIPDPLTGAIHKLTSMGILVVAAAGNSGPLPFTVGTPGSAPCALTVASGGVPRGDLASFSSRGPALSTFDVKPDVMAPGGLGGLFQGPEYLYGPSAGLLDEKDGLAPGWSALHGTSMSAAQMTGLLALLLERYAFTRAQLGAAVEATSRRYSWWGKDVEHGWGFVDGRAMAAWFEGHGGA